MPDEPCFIIFIDVYALIFLIYIKKIYYYTYKMFYKDTSII